MRGNGYRLCEAYATECVNQKKMYYFHGDKRWILDLSRFIDVKVDKGIDDITFSQSCETLRNEFSAIAAICD